MTKTDGGARISRRTVMAGGAAALAAPFVPGGRARAATRVAFQLDWKFNAQFAGLFVAEADGLYEEAGLDVTVSEWKDGLNVADEVASGRADLGCAEQNLIIGARADGAPVKALATMFQASPYGLMAPPGRPLASLDDLLGESVGVHVDGVKVMALVKGVNGLAADAFAVEEIPYADKFGRAVSGELYAVQCYVIDEPIGVAAEYGEAPAVMKLSDHGFVSTAQTIFASERVLAERPEAVRAFLAATFEGWRRALSDKEAAATVTVDRFVPEGSPYKDVPYQVEVLRLLEPYVLGGGGMAEIGVIDVGMWEKAARQMAEYGIVPALPDLPETLAPGFYGRAG